MASRAHRVLIFHTGSEPAPAMVEDLIGRFRRDRPDIDLGGSVITTVGSYVASAGLDEDLAMAFVARLEGDGELPPGALGRMVVMPYLVGRDGGRWLVTAVLEDARSGERPGRSALPSSPAAGTVTEERRSDHETRRRTRLHMLRMLFADTRMRDPWAMPLILLGFMVPLALGVLGGLSAGPLFVWIIIGVAVGLLVALNVFSRRVQKIAYADMEGKPGAAVRIVERMRGGYHVTPAVQVNGNLGRVHRVVCRAGIVLLAEGTGTRVLLSNEISRLREVDGALPVHPLVVGNREGEVPLAKLEKRLMRMRRKLNPAQVDFVFQQLDSLR